MSKKRYTIAYCEKVGSRIISWCAYNGKDFSFLSSKQIGAKLRLGEKVNGLMLDSDKNVVIDHEYAPHMLLAKSGRSFFPLESFAVNKNALETNTYLALVKVVYNEAGTEYHFITNCCGQEIYSEEEVKAMLPNMALAGIQLSSTGELVIHEGVDIVGQKMGHNEQEICSEGEERSRD